MDVWAAGVTLWNLSTGAYPFEDEIVFNLYTAISNGKKSHSPGRRAFVCLFFALQCNFASVMRHFHLPR